MGEKRESSRGISLALGRVAGRDVEAMRKRYRVLILAAFVAALVVPLGFALSLESSSAAVQDTPAVAADVVASSSVAMTAPVLIRDHSAAPPFMPQLSDSAKLFFVGSALFGLAAAVRRSA
jgi:hypothetical protein